jgi:ubiquinone/menaquinone biosynthesis C-methylase UbiE/uncharacterized protein YbaR (Trm112 family)
VNSRSVEYLVCPECDHEKLEIEAYEYEGGHIREGRLICRVCATWYRIEREIADLLPLRLRNYEVYAKFGIKYNLKESKNRTVLMEEEKSNQIEFFNQHVNEYEEKVVRSKYYQALDEVAFVDWLKKNLTAGQKVLNLGCGTGRQDIPLAQHDVRTIGIDISENMLLLAKEKINSLSLNEYCDFIIGDAENPPVADETFDACILYGTLHHLADQQGAIANAARKIVKDGLFYSLDPHKSPVRFLFDLLMRIWKLYDEEASDTALLCKKTLIKWLNEANIKNNIKLSTYIPPHVYELLSSQVSTHLLRISDSIFNKLPLAKDLAGVIIAEGIKK